MSSYLPLECDVLVIGGGPAGSIAAGVLAQKNIKVVVLEKEKFPRNTIGESLIPHFWRFTDLIGASEAIEAEGFIVKAGGIVHWDGVQRKMSFNSFGFKRPALHVERDVFDKILLDRVKEIGAAVYEEVKVLKVETSSDTEVTVVYNDIKSGTEGTIKASYLIDATGQQAILAKQQKTRVFDENFNFQAIWGYFDQSDYYDKDKTLRGFSERKTHNPVTTIASIGDWGWCWHIVQREKVSVGLMVAKSQLSKFKEGGATLAERFEFAARNVPMIGDLLQEGKLIEGSVNSIRDYAYQSTELIMNNCFLVGDAAAFVDPISSEGVPMAMYGGYLAAWGIENCLKNPKRKSFYRDLCLKEYKKRLNVFKMLAYPGHGLPDDLSNCMQEGMRNFGESEIQLIIAQSKMTGRIDNIAEIIDVTKLPEGYLTEW